jgi:hypothetical protein
MACHKPKPKVGPETGNQSNFPFDVFLENAGTFDFVYLMSLFDKRTSTFNHQVKEVDSLRC